MKIEVIFRKEKDGEILAVFPYNLGYSTFVECHTSEGHCECDYFEYVLKKTKLATEEEYKYRKRLLVNYYGYDLKVIKKRNHKKFLKHFYERQNNYHNENKI